MNVGAPGTGKTTVANRMGKMFKSLGILQGSDVVCKTASDFSGHTGQVGLQTREILNEGLGRVLFVDEAYRLRDPFMKEAVNELVQVLLLLLYYNYNFFITIMTIY